MKKGDTIICINDHYIDTDRKLSLTIGNKYLVKDIILNSNTTYDHIALPEIVLIINDNGNEAYFNKNQFIEIDEYRDKTINYLLDER